MNKTDFGDVKSMVGLKTELIEVGEAGDVTWRCDPSRILTHENINNAILIDLDAKRVAYSNSKSERICVQDIFRLRNKLSNRKNQPFSVSLAEWRESAENTEDSSATLPHFFY